MSFVGTIGMQYPSMYQPVQYTYMSPTNVPSAIQSPTNVPINSASVMSPTNVPVGGAAGAQRASTLSRQPAPSDAAASEPVKTVKNPEVYGSKVELAKTTKEREKYDSLADIYALVKVLDALEKGYIRDVIPSKEYEKECYRYLGLFKTAYEACEQDVGPIEKFVKEMKLDCNAALKRIKLGVPATVEHGSNVKTDTNNDVAIVAKLTSTFVTAMDCAGMEIVAVDSISIYITELMSCLNQLTRIPPDSPIKTKIKEWVMTLNSMKASDDLSEEQCRQLKLDLETCYNMFMSNLS